MAGLSRVDPDDIHAVVVGLENYPRAPLNWSLRGAGSDALRFVRWLLAGSVPPRNIRLLLSPLEESRSLSEAVTEAGVRWRTVASSNEIRDVFTQELKDARGKLLYVYWGGHGVLGDEGRLLFYPDASPEDKVSLSVEDLRSFLTHLSCNGFRQQVLLFDACATFVEDHPAESRPIVLPFPRPARQTAQQSLLHASRDGQAAEHDLSAGSGVFSAMLLGWLERHASDLHPDLNQMQDAIREHFERRRACGDTDQTPVTCRYLTLDGEEETQVYTAPIDRTALLHVVGTLEEALPDEGIRKVYAARTAAACGLPRLATRYSTEYFAEVLLSTRRALATLIAALAVDGESTAAESLLVVALAEAAPGLLSVDEYAALRELSARVPEISPAMVNAITDQVLPGGSDVRLETGGPVRGPQLMAHIERLERYPGGFSQVRHKRRMPPAVVRFTQHLAALCDGDRRWSQRLDQWGRRVAERLGVDADLLDDLCDEAEAWAESLTAAGHPPRLVVHVHPDHAHDTFVCVVWSDPGTGELVRYDHLDNGEPLSSEQAVQLIERAIRSLSVSDAAAPLVEMVLDPADIGTVPVHTWNGAEAESLFPLLLAVRRRMALRCAQLARPEYEEDRRVRLERRWNRCADGKVVHLYESHALGMGAYSALEEDHDAARVVIHAGRGTNERMIQLALRLGYPVIMWDHEATEAVPADHFDPLVPDGTLSDLPERVRRYWAKACAGTTEHPARPALLLDDPGRRLPPAPPITSRPG
ncbi:VMAP-C domain-containing protein [Streptomyces griseosporeus]|uniref:VMAP-C domain-containing protein n=1 Tax=Streptomyces griseosporeus TaxID=1910 RepID=UPI00378C21B7